MPNDALIPGPLSIAQLLELQDAEQSGVLPRNNFSRALAASLIVKPGQGKLYGLSVTSTKAATQFVQVFDSSVLPADGAVPLISFSVPATSAGGLYFGSVGRAFEQGIVVCNSSTQATKTIGSADCLFDAQFI
jgi:hypothetical protein